MQTPGLTRLSNKRRNGQKRDWWTKDSEEPSSGPKTDKHCQGHKNTPTTLFKTVFTTDIITAFIVFFFFDTSRLKFSIAL